MSLIFECSSHCRAPRHSLPAILCRHRCSELRCPRLPDQTRWAQTLASLILAGHRLNRSGLQDPGQGPQALRPHHLRPNYNRLRLLLSAHQRCLWAGRALRLLALAAPIVQTSRHESSQHRKRPIIGGRASGDVFCQWCALEECHPRPAVGLWIEFGGSKHGQFRAQQVDGPG